MDENGLTEQEQQDAAAIEAMRVLTTGDKDGYHKASSAPWTWDDRFGCVMSPDSKGDPDAAVISAQSWGDEWISGVTVDTRSAADKSFVILSRTFADASLRTIDRRDAELARVTAERDALRAAIENTLPGLSESADWFGFPNDYETRRAKLRKAIYEVEAALGTTTEALISERDAQAAEIAELKALKARVEKEHAEMRTYLSEVGRPSDESGSGFVMGYAACLRRVNRALGIESEDVD